MASGAKEYKQAGVDLDAAVELVDVIRPIVKETFTEPVLGTIGGFSGAFSAKHFMSMKHPVLVSSTDGVGTKLKIAFMMDKHDTVGIDLVAMCVNDLLVGGAKPLFLLDYLSLGKMDLDLAEVIVSGIAEGCKQAQCALIGGETAEMPGFYGEGEYDMAGFVVGLVDKHNIIEGPKRIKIGNKLIGFPASGLHSNGYSLARKICFETLGLTVDSYVEELGRTLGEELLEPTKIYFEVISQMLDKHVINGFVNITGGGWPDNFERVLPDDCAVIIEKEKIPQLPIFSFLQKAGKVTDRGMQRTFNNGLGFAGIVKEGNVDDVIDIAKKAGEEAFYFGEVVERKGKSVIVV